MQQAKSKKIILKIHVVIIQCKPPITKSYFCMNFPCKYASLLLCELCIIQNTSMVMKKAANRRILLLDELLISGFYCNYGAYCNIVPNAAPLDVNATSYTPTSITVCFEFPEGSTQNGLIASFNVTLVGSPFDTESQTISIPVTTTNYPLTGSICSDVTNLQEYNYYLIRVLMINSVGSGPNSTSIDVRTIEAGIFHY